MQFEGVIDVILEKLIVASVMKYLFQLQVQITVQFSQSYF
jgi:hypothetical protein